MMEPDKTTLADRLKLIRESLGYSQKEMAAAVNASFAALQGYEAGRNIPGGKVFEYLACMGFNANWILTGEGEMKIGWQHTYLLTNEGRKPIVVHEPLLEAAILFVDIYEQLLDGTKFTPDRKAETIIKMCNKWSDDGTYVKGNTAIDILTKVGIKDAYDNLMAAMPPRESNPLH